VTERAADKPRANCPGNRTGGRDLAIAHNLRDLARVHTQLGRTVTNVYIGRLAA
jgi:hypothetical protein